jgi:hypothetical protein
LLRTLLQTCLEQDDRGKSDNTDEDMLEMSEHLGELEDPFADLQPESRRSERTIKILALATFIASAKDRGNSWANICRRLEEKKGITISPDHLRMTMERYADYRAKPRKRIKPNTKRAVKTNMGANTKASIKQANDSNPKEQPSNTVATTEPIVGPSPETGQSPFLKMGKKL